MRICLFGQGPLCEAVHAALSAQGHTLLGPYVSPQPTEVLRSTQASVGLSCGYRHKLLPQEWECFPDGILNLHTGYLPWNRGAYPNVWPILDGSPAGVTLHQVDAGIDTGPILLQERVTVEPYYTAGRLYHELVKRGVEMVVAAVTAAEDMGWPQGTPQDPTAGSVHRKADWHRNQEHLFLDHYGEGALSPADLLADIRARTFDGEGISYRPTLWIDKVGYEVDLRMRPVAYDVGNLEATISIKEVTE